MDTHYVARLHGEVSLAREKGLTLAMASTDLNTRCSVRHAGHTGHVVYDFTDVARPQRGFVVFRGWGGEWGMTVGENVPFGRRNILEVDRGMLHNCEDTKPLRGAQ